jgi:hypothetical protein
MAQTVQARIGDSVRANFNLIFKNAEVNKLSDKGNFVEMGFMMECRRTSPTESVAFTASSGLATGPIRCREKPPIGDDQPVEVDFFFEGADKFRANDVWKLSFVYMGGGAPFPGGDDPHPRKHLLGMVQLVG